MERYDAREQELGEELMGQLERFLLLQIIDERWREHLFDMDYLREGIHLRGFAQIDPLVAYKNEAYTLFGDLMNSIWTDYARMIFNVQVSVDGPPRPRTGAAPVAGLRRRRQPHAPRACLLLGWQRRDGSRRDRCRGRGRRRLDPARPAQAYAANGGGEERELAPMVEQRVVDAEHAGGAQRPLLVRLWQEVQALPRRIGRRR